MQRNLFAFSNDVCICFTIKRLFDGGPVMGFDYQNWIGEIRKADPSDVSYTALQCLAAAFFARMHGNPPTIMAQGAALYGKALRQLSSRIEDNSTCFDHENVSATMALHLYEILRALIIRKRTFLEKEEWKVLPWARYPETKTPMHSLQDIFCDFPGFCEDRLVIDAAAARGEDTSNQRRALEAKLVSAFRDLVRWRWQWEADNPNVVHERPIDPIRSLSVDSVGPLFESILHFQSLEYATEIVLYNTLLQIFAHFYQDFTKSSIFRPGMSIWPNSERPQPTNPLTLPSELLQIDDSRLETCRSMEYHLSGSHASSGAFAVMFPLRICFAGLCMTNNTRVILWVIQLCKMIADSTGFELSRHMFSLKHLSSGQRINEAKNYVSPEIMALVEAKEAEIL